MLEIENMKKIRRVLSWKPSHIENTSLWTHIISGKESVMSTKSSGSATVEGATGARVRSVFNCVV